MKVLLVGAGCVGQAYGRHLQLGGAEVSFCVKPKYVAACQAGFALYPLNRWFGKWTPVHFKADGIITSFEGVTPERFDAVILCVSSTALGAEWLAEMRQAIGDTTVVMLQPGLKDRDLLLEHLDAEQLVCGLITLNAYKSPMGDEQVPEPGTAYYFPPFSPCPLSGQTGRVQPLVEVFRKGGFPAKHAADITRMSAIGPAVLSPLMATLELSDWRFAKLRKCSNLKLATQAIREASAVAAKEKQVSVPLLIKLGIRPFFLWWASLFAPLAMPFNLEKFFQEHFTKVGDQTRQSLDTYVREGEARDQPVERLKELRERLPEWVHA